MNNLKSLIRLFLLLALAITFQDANAQRTKFNFNGGWKIMKGDVKNAEGIRFNDADWKSITLPQDFNEDEAFKVAIDDHSTSIVWYRKHFKVPQHYKNGQKVFLEFEGIRQAGDFYLNGHYIGKHENGAMAFGFDVSGLIKYNEENVISARIDNSWEYKEVATQTKFQWINKNFNANYGGITKNVYLHVTGKLHQTLPLYSNLKTTGVYIYAKEHEVKAKTATIVAESEVKNDDGQTRTFTYEVKIDDLDGKTIKTFTGDAVTVSPNETKIVKAMAKVANLEFWSWGYGYLYTVTTTLKVDGKAVDAVKTVTGFRKTAFTDGMVRLNDRVLQMKGYAQRTSNEWPAIGMSVQHG